MRILIATVRIPFVNGGAENLAEGLRDALSDAGHEAEILAIPFKWYPPERILDHMLAFRLFDLSESSGAAIDLVIGLKFPAYLVPAENKVLWLLHQHRQAYDQWGHEICDLDKTPARGAAPSVHGLRRLVQALLELPDVEGSRHGAEGEENPHEKEDRAQDHQLPRNRRVQAPHAPSLTKTSSGVGLFLLRLGRSGEPCWKWMCFALVDTLDTNVESSSCLLRHSRPGHQPRRVGGLQLTHH